MMEDVYKSRLPRAFAKVKRFRWLRFLLNGTRHMYYYKPFLNALGPFAEGKLMSDIEWPAILLTTKDLRTSNTYYITNQGPGAAMFAHWPLVGAVATSVAAPLFSRRCRVILWMAASALLGILVWPCPSRRCNTWVCSRKPHPSLLRPRIYLERARRRGGGQLLAEILGRISNLRRYG